jgi:hypothetical protein
MSVKAKLDEEKSTIVLTILVVSLVLFAPFLAKVIIDDESFFSEDTYYHLRMVEQFEQNFLSKRDIQQNREYDFNLFHFIFSALNPKEDLYAKILPPILGILSLILIYFIMRKINLGQNDIFFAMIILATTPVFLYDFTTFSPEILAMPILLAGLLLYIRGNFLSVFFFALLPLLNIFYAILALILLTADYVFRHRHKVLLYSNAGAILAAIITGATLLHINYLTSFVPLMTGINGLLIEFGAIKGFSLITIGLGILGLFSWWKSEAQRTSILIGFFILFAATVFFSEIRLPVAVIFAVFAAFSVSYLTNREWEIHELKGVTLLLILCILFFSAVLSLNFQVRTITDQEVSSMKLLASPNYNNGGAVLSLENNGFLIEYASGKTAYLDSLSFKFDDYSARKEIANLIYYSRNLNEVENRLLEENITYILITNDMREGKVWSGRFEGLLFLLETSDKFSKVFYDENIQIYKHNMK